MVDKSISLMPEDIQRLMGKDAQRDNIFAAKMISEVVKTTLGPKGMDKMLVSPTKEIIITNDGVTILSEMRIEHPAAKMMVEIAKTQESEVGDGTTTSVMLAGKLLENAEKLLDMKIHPTVIAKGYKIASDKCQEILGEISLKIDSGEDNDEVLEQIAMTAMTGKGAENSKDRFSKIIVRAVKQVASSENKVDVEDIKIKKCKGSSVKDTEFISGVAVSKERVSYDMPKFVRDAQIALVDFPLEWKSGIGSNVSVSSPEQVHAFMNKEETEIKNMVGKVRDSGVNVLFCQKGIDDFAQYLLSKEGIYACSRVSRQDMESLSKATGARIVSNLNDLNTFELGNAQIVESLRQGEDSFTLVKGCKNPKTVTILIHGGTEHVLDEIERALQDGIGDVICSLESGLVVPGGGAIESEIAKRLREFAQTLSSNLGRERLAVEEFASALEFIPITLAENAGIDPIEVLTELRSKHNSGDMNAGLNLFTNKVENVLESKIIEPAKIKTQAINSASEVAVMILRIDDVIASKSNPKGNMNFSGKMPDYMGGLS